MTQPTDYPFHPQADSGQGLHTQESGEAGLSSNMEHKFSDNYTERALPVADKGSFVKPIPKGERDILEHSEVTGKIWSPSALFVHDAGPKAEPHPVIAEEGFLKPSTVAVFQRNNFPPQTAPMALPENNPEQETDKGLPRTSAITEEQPDAEVVEGDVYEMPDNKMDTEGKPAKPKGPPQIPGREPPLGGRNTKQRRKRTPGKNRKLYLLCWMAFIVPVSEGFGGPKPAADQRSLKFFACKDKDRCLTLMTVYDPEDVPVYQRARNQKFPKCCEISPPTSDCVVCLCEHNITIICSEDVRPKEAEDSSGEELLLLKIAPVCVQQHTCGRGHHGLWIFFGLFLIVGAALVIYIKCCQKNRIENEQ